MTFPTVFGPLCVFFLMQVPTNRTRIKKKNIYFEESGVLARELSGRGKKVRSLYAYAAHQRASCFEHARIYCVCVCVYVYVYVCVCVCLCVCMM